MAEIDETGPTGCAEILRDEPGDPVVRLTGEIDLANADSLAAKLEPVLSMRPAQLVVDVSGLEFMDSSGIALLVRCAQKVGRLRLRHPSPIIRRTVESLGLANVLHLDP